MDSAEALRKFLAETPFRYEIVADGSRISEAFEAWSKPQHLLIDPQGRIVWRGVGASPRNLKTLKGLIERELKKSGR
ncbi:MAG: hypothetical protein V3T83_16695 [Acidobacteriota bacterium]